MSEAMCERADSQSPKQTTDPDWPDTHSNQQQVSIAGPQLDTCLQRQTGEEEGSHQTNGGTTATDTGALLRATYSQKESGGRNPGHSAAFPSSLSNGIPCPAVLKTRHSRTVK
ncbi:Hypothetical predicted protein [Pelobates cultripes]|uniref:Uncharacterized protein n=1 Tax=Pelobates cultripes TaxID=61616 RepID=A0AAD1QZB7_PELCU|nr:Hypothetical predicted protein [Pelobates cultripes]